MNLFESVPGDILCKNLNPAFISKKQMVNYWLAKQEPSGPRGYNFSTLQKEKTTVWDGVSQQSCT